MLLRKLRDLLFDPATLCVLAILVCIASSYPSLELGYNDDWSYTWSARVLADTGHVVYNGWSTAMLGWQLYLGAAFIKLFGFSFAAMRCSTLLVAVATTVLMHRSLIRFGVNSWNATLATLTIALSPVFLILSYSFMSDIAGMFALLLCLYACLRAIQAHSDRAAIQWLVAAAFSNVVGGTARQIAWLGVLVVVPSAGWLMRRRRPVAIVAVVLWLGGAVAVRACLHWFKTQPYSLTDPLFTHTRYFGFLPPSVLVRCVLGVCVMALPALAAFALRVSEGRVLLRSGAAICATLFTALTYFSLRHFYSVSPQKDYYLYFPFLGNIITPNGLSFLVGSEPAGLSMPARLVLTWVTITVIFCIFGWWLGPKKLEGMRDIYAGAVSNATVRTLVYPLLVAYLLLLATRGASFDRYYLPAIFIAFIPALRFYQTRIAQRLPFVCFVFIAIFALFGIASMHDLFSLSRARLAAAKELQDAGVAKTAFRAGLEYDAWTQLETTEYMNDARITTPADAFNPLPKSVATSCTIPFEGHTPSIHAQYIVSYDPTSCFARSQFAPIPYTAWLGQHHRMLYIQKVRY